MQVPIIVYYTMEINRKTWIDAPSVKVHGTNKVHQIIIAILEEIMLRLFGISLYLSICIGYLQMQSRIYWVA